MVDDASPPSARPLYDPFDPSAVLLIEAKSIGIPLTHPCRVLRFSAIATLLSGEV